MYEIMLRSITKISELIKYKYLSSTTGWYKQLVVLGRMCDTSGGTAGFYKVWVNGVDDILDTIKKNGLSL